MRAHRRRPAPSSTSARPVATAGSRTSSGSGSPGGVQTTCSGSAVSAATVRSSSPARIAAASRAIPRPYRCTVCSTEIPSPNALRGVTGWTSGACPIASVTAARVPCDITGPSATGPTMSRSTAPASIDASCSTSPTSSSRASWRTASSNRAIRVSGTIEVSSTTITSLQRATNYLARCDQANTEYSLKWFIQAGTSLIVAPTNAAWVAF